MNLNMFFDALTKEEKAELLKIALQWRDGPLKIILQWRDGPKYEIPTTTKTPVTDWINQHPQMSTKLSNILRGFYNDEPPFLYMEEINKHDFLCSRNAGIKSWKEFVKLRGWE